MTPQVQSYAIAAGLVVVAIFALVVLWKVTKSLVVLAFWFALALAVAGAAWWLLAKEGILPPLFAP